MTIIQINHELSPDATIFTSSMFAVIRYANCGAYTEQEQAAFDGWYTSEAFAKMVYDDWVQRYPNTVIAIVEQVEAKWP